MIFIGVFVALVFLYSLISRRLERTVITAPIIFTAVGLLIFLMPPWLSALEVTREAFLPPLEAGTDITHGLADAVTSPAPLVGSVLDQGPIAPLFAPR
jgi:sodium/hydrogen antiporter